MVIADWNETLWYGSFNVLCITFSLYNVQFPDKESQITGDANILFIKSDVKVLHSRHSFLAWQEQ
jgi:hypothetical protein